MRLAVYGYYLKADSQRLCLWLAAASLTIVAVQSAVDFYLRLKRSQQVETVLALVAKGTVATMALHLEPLFRNKADRLQYPPHSGRPGGQDA